MISNDEHVWNNDKIVSAKQNKTKPKEEPRENFRSQTYSNNIKQVMGLISRKEKTEELEDGTIEMTNLNNRENTDLKRKNE